MFFMLDGLIYFVKVIFVPKYVSRVVFKGGILGGACQFWGNLYLYSTTVLFDNEVEYKAGSSFPAEMDIWLKY